MPKLKYILLYHTLFHFATGYAPARTVSPYSENLRYWMTSASRSDVFASLIVMYCADGAKTILYRFHMTFLSVHIVVCRVSTLRLHSTWHTPCSAEKRWQENCRDRSTAVRSRSGSDTAPWCHSRPSRRFATSRLSASRGNETGGEEDLRQGAEYSFDGGGVLHPEGGAWGQA